MACKSEAEESTAAVAMPSAFTRAWLLDGRVFRSIPPPAALCVSVCHLLLRWTDKTGWQGSARVTGQNYAVINPSISPTEDTLFALQKASRLLRPSMRGGLMRNLPAWGFWGRNSQNSDKRVHRRLQVWSLTLNSN